MIALRYIMRFFLSIKTSVWLLFSLLALFFAGAFVMPGEGAFQLIHSVPLFEWLGEQPVRISWWLWGCICIIGVLTVNTLFCSVESVIKKRKTEKWLMIIAPQVVHIGFLFMLLAHFTSSLGGFKSMGIWEEGGILYLSNGRIQFSRIDISADPAGYIIDWSVAINYISENVQRKGTIRPNSPFFQDGTGIYVRDLRVLPDKQILVEVSREPGGLWALVGGILFTAGTITLLVLRMRRDHQVLQR